MINQVSDSLFEWAKALSGVQQVSFQMPAQPEEDLTTVHIYLMEISDDARRHNTGRPPVQPSLRYLLTTSGKDIRNAHKLLYVLLYSALQNPDFEVEFDPVNSMLWTALQTPPRPAFIIRVPLTHEWPPISVPRVKDVRVGLYALVWLFGQVLGPGDVPIEQARVEVKDVHKDSCAYTDRMGCFSIPNVAATPNRKTLTVTAQGCEQVFSCEETGSIDSPQIFRMAASELPQ